MSSTDQFTLINLMQLVLIKQLVNQQFQCVFHSTSAIIQHPNIVMHIHNEYTVIIKIFF